MHEGQSYARGAEVPAGACKTCHCGQDGKVRCAEGNCTQKVCGGLRGDACGEGQYCDYEDKSCGAADQTGVCKVKPEGCTGDYTPVCGCDGKTYSNACAAHAAGISVQAEGTCEKPQEGCVVNGKRFKPGDSFPSTDGCNTCSCGRDGSVGCTKRGCSSLEQCSLQESSNCKADQYCAFARGYCVEKGWFGMCTPKPKTCTEEYAPVCGCDGKTYSNECSAHFAGTSVVHIGECGSQKGYCRYEGQMHKEGETFQAKDGCNTCTCQGGHVTCSGQSCQSCGGFRGARCGEGEMCYYTLGDICGFADATGVCRPKPTQCAAISAPVCGCDNKTYANECEANRAGVSIQKRSACQRRSCSYQGKVYKDGEQFSTADGCTRCTCQDGRVSCTTGAACPPRSCGGRKGNTCKADEFCKYERKSCGYDDGTGVCTPRPGACPEHIAPVCGCDGKTYTNSCDAERAGTSVFYDGKCKTEPPKTCTHDGKTYQPGDRFSSGYSCCTCGKDGSIACTDGGPCPSDTPKTCNYNGKTYKVGDFFDAKDGCNTCLCQSDGTVGCSEKACQPKTCNKNDNSCGSGEFCDEPKCGTTDQAGTCRPKPSTCPAGGTYVCGCNGKTYLNACEANGDGTSVSHEGKCR